MSKPRERPQLPVLELGWPEGPRDEILLGHEWLLTNGLGGYAAGTVARCSTRKYHGLFIPNLERLGRTVMLARMEETATVDGEEIRLDCFQTLDGELTRSALTCLASFRLRGLLPEWEFALDGARLRRRLVMVHGQNTLFVSYQHLGGAPVELKLRPFPVFRSHDGPLLQGNERPGSAHLRGGRVELRATEEAPPLRLRLYSSCEVPFVGLSATTPPMLYRVEKARGYEHVEVQHSPGYYACALGPGETLSLGVTIGDWEALELQPEEAFALEAERELRLLERAPEEARAGVGARLVLAADQFVIEPTNRSADEAWAHATGEDARSVIAGYPWFTDWGRDTMISLEGLTLSTGRHREAAAILRTFLHYVKDGLLPNLFPEGENQGLYHTADATLWLFHALHRYLEATGDGALLRTSFPVLQDIVAQHQRGTRFHIGVDPADGLLRQGEKGYQLTWMDAKVDGWVVTPRRGKAVELNALWFNALRLMADWADELGEASGPYLDAAERTYGAFNQRFWNAGEACLHDVVDGESPEDDQAVRPNQVFAVSLAHPVLRRDRWAPVLEKVKEALLTPVGLRTLSPEHRKFRKSYDGDLRARDAAYHQGTVWPWLIGHYVDAQVKLNGDRGLGRSLLAGLEANLRDGCIGQVSEIFDAMAPFRCRGCFAQAWSVAELLRAWLKTA